MRNEKLELTREQRTTSIPHSLFPIPHFLFHLLIILLLIGCTSVVQKGGEIVEGSAFSKTRLAHYSSAGKSFSRRSGEAKVELRELILDNGEWATEISSSQWPGLTLCGGMPAGNGSIELTGARILSSHVNGWNEFTLDLLGQANFYNPRKSGGELSIKGDVERVQISSGKIRLKSSRLTGDAALTALRNRRERILALTEWMHECEAGLSEQAALLDQVRIDQDEFEKYWKPRLFPELVSELLSRAKRPPEYYAAQKSAPNIEWGRKDSIKWNLTYTESVFPGDLREYRNSGAMLRDWEEALPWIFMEYSWDYILNSFNDTDLIRIK